MDMRIEDLRMNFLSEKLCQKSYYILKKRKIRKNIKNSFWIFGIVTIIEISCILANIVTYNFNEVKLPSVEQEQVKNTQIENDNIKKKLSIISQAEKDDKEVIKVLDILSKIKPQKIQFVRFQIDSKGKIILVCKAENPNDFNDFVKKIKENTTFKDVRLENFVTSKEKKKEYKIGTISTEVKDKA